MRKNKSICIGPSQKIIQNTYIFSGILIFAFILVCCAKLIYGQEQPELSYQSDIALKQPKTAKPVITGIKDLGGRLFLDRAVEVGQSLQVDKHLEFVGISTPSFTLSSNHANLWLNNTQKALCARFDNSTSGCLAFGSVISGFLTESSATATYLQITNAASTYLTQSSATATYGQLAAPNAWTKDNTFTSGNSQAITVLSGNSGTYANIAVGRTAGEGRFAVAAGANQFAVGSVAGDMILRNDSASFRLILNAGGDTGIKISSNNVVVDSSMTVAYQATFSTAPKLSTLTSTILATDSNGVIVSTSVSSSLPSGACFNLQSACYTGSSATVATSFIPTPLVVNITPTSSSNNVKISASGFLSASLNGDNSFFTVKRSSTTDLGETVNGFGFGYTLGLNSANGPTRGVVSMNYVDSPATTSSTSYGVYIKSGAGTNTTTWGGSAKSCILVEECKP